MRGLRISPTSTGRLRRWPIVNVSHFAESTRDSGYKSTASAVAELVDNGFQAGARRVQIFVKTNGRQGGPDVSVAVLDDGSGMSEATLRHALQFGGSSRHGDRSGIGRYGMGLPNSSFSQARRVTVYSWRRQAPVLRTYLDLDSIIGGRQKSIPLVTRCALPRAPSPARRGYRAGR